MAGLVAAAVADPMLAATGDIACAPGSIEYDTACRQSATASLIADAHPSAVAPVGDIQYETGALAEFTGTGAFDDSWGELKPLMHPVPGNHEYTVSPTASGYFEYFGSAAGPLGRGYYSYQLGKWHLIALNSACSDFECNNSEFGRVTTAELRWLASDLAHARHRCILAYWHHPLFSSSAIGGEIGVAPLWRMLFRARADVVLNGHVHSYERFAQQDPNGRPTRNGIREFVVGTGGKSLLPFSSTHVLASQHRDGDDFGALLLTLRPNRYDWRFRTTRGTVEDSGSTRCHTAGHGRRH
jgi:hypothetical protein